MTRQDFVEDSKTARKARIGRACDGCRLRKVKCDNPEMKALKCTTCRENQIACTYEISAPKRGHSKRAVLERRLAKMEDYLRSYLTHDEFEREFSEDAVPNHPTLKTPNKLLLMNGGAARTTPNSLIINVDEDEDSELEELNDSFSSMNTSTGTRARYGKASRTVLTQQAWSIREKTGPGTLQRELRCSMEQHPWERQWPQYDLDGRPLYLFPPPDLFAHLVDLYFRANNSSWPILHQPTFMAQLATGLHFHDHMFGANVLIVCALGGRFSDDPRVFREEYSTPMTAGWKWFCQVDISRTVVNRPTLFDIQFYCLVVQFLYGTSNAQSCWILTGVGIRLAQEAGADRRTGRPPNVIDEQWKRAWWVLVVIDRMISETLGRAPAVKDEDMTQVLPMECDDEYWEPANPIEAFKQPGGQPSKCSGFITLIGLVRILGISLRTIYCVNRKRLHPKTEVAPVWDKQVVAELQSALQSWLEKLPPHLQRANHKHVVDLFFRQSVGLHCLCYSIMINVHRPFLDLTGEPSKLSSSYMNLCIKTARSGVAMLHKASERMPVTHEGIDGFVYSAGVILLLNQWTRAKTGSAQNAENSDTENVEKCVAFLQQRSARRPTTTSYAKHLEQLVSSKAPQQLQQRLPPAVHLSDVPSLEVNGGTSSSLDNDAYTPQLFPIGTEVDINSLFAAPYLPVQPTPLDGTFQAHQGTESQLHGEISSHDFNYWSSYMELLNGQYFDVVE